MKHVDDTPATLPLVQPESCVTDDIMQSVLQRDKTQFIEKIIVRKVNMTKKVIPPITSLAQDDRTSAAQKGGRATETGQDRVSAAPMAMRMAVPPRNLQLERQLKAVEADLQWLRELNLASLEKPRKWTFMPLSWHLPRMMARFKRKGLFDEQAYMDRYPDVVDSGMDPLVHYLKHGMKENRER